MTTDAKNNNAPHAAQGPSTASPTIDAVAAAAEATRAAAEHLAAAAHVLSAAAGASVSLAEDVLARVRAEARAELREDLARGAEARGRRYTRHAQQLAATGQPDLHGFGEAARVCHGLAMAIREDDLAYDLSMDQSNAYLDELERERPPSATSAKTSPPTSTKH